MPSIEHDLLVDLFRDDPRQVVRVLADVLGISVPSDAEPALHSQTFGEVKASPHSADLVVKLTRGERSYLGVVTEVQLTRKDEKRVS